MPLLSSQSPGTQAKRTLGTKRGIKGTEALCLLHGTHSPQLSHKIWGGFWVHFYHTPLPLIRARSHETELPNAHHLVGKQSKNLVSSSFVKGKASAHCDKNYNQGDSVPPPELIKSGEIYHWETEYMVAATHIFQVLWLNLHLRRNLMKTPLECRDVKKNKVLLSCTQRAVVWMCNIVNLHFFKMNFYLFVLDSNWPWAVLLLLFPYPSAYCNTTPLIIQPLGQHQTV